MRDQRCGNEHVPRDRRFASLGVVRAVLPNEAGIVSPLDGTEQPSVNDRVELQRVGQKEHAVDSWAPFEVDKVHRVRSSMSRLVQSSSTSAIDTWSAIPKVRSDRRTGRRLPRRAAYGSSGDDALILLRKAQHVLAESIRCSTVQCSRAAILSSAEDRPARRYSTPASCALQNAPLSDTVRCAACLFVLRETRAACPALPLRRAAARAVGGTPLRHRAPHGSAASPHAPRSAVHPLTSNSCADAIDGSV